MFAIIETGGKQYTVSPAQTLQIEKLAVDANNSIVFDKVLLIADGDNVSLGKPYLSGATVTASVVDQGRGKKIDIFKYKAKSKYRRSMGHRQSYTEVKIGDIKAS